MSDLTYSPRTPGRRTGSMVRKRNGRGLDARLLQLKRDLRVDSIANDPVPFHRGLEVLDVDRPDVRQRLCRLLDRLRCGIFPALLGLGQNLDDFHNVGHIDLLKAGPYPSGRCLQWVESTKRTAPWVTRRQTPSAVSV